MRDRANACAIPQFVSNRTATPEPATERELSPTNAAGRHHTARFDTFRGFGVPVGPAAQGSAPVSAGRRRSVAVGGDDQDVAVRVVRDLVGHVAEREPTRPVHALAADHDHRRADLCGDAK
jgi:hypothetical protein